MIDALQLAGSTLLGVALLFGPALAVALRRAR